MTVDVEQGERDDLTPARLTWRLNPPPSWPPAPESFTAVPNWSPDPSWPRPPRRWRLWQPAPASAGSSWPVVNEMTSDRIDLRYAPPLAPPPTEQQRTRLRREVLVVLSVFPLPALLTAIVLLVRRAVEGEENDPLQVVLTHHPLPSAVLGAVLYASALSVIPLVWLVLSTQGLSLRSLGLSRQDAVRESKAGVLLALAGFGTVIVIFIVAALAHLTNAPGTYGSAVTHLPRVYLIEGLAISVVTALVEETVVNGYLQTRLAQLGWSPNGVFWTSLAVRTSYHVYYGLGAVFTIPVGYLLTRSFQRRRRLLRCVIAHALYDSVLLTAALLSG
jgi:membrane protease YdiL (CAAX protease family)